MDPETRDDFRVAIICALPLEAAAVLDLFDQRYDKDGSRYGKQDGDNNAYTFGRISRHDIILVHMPGMGVYNATRVASNIRLSFKEVRLALVVGVCGGVPLKQPMILGDIIISNSVIEFYTGRQYPDGVQARRGVKHTLGRPNPEIRALLSKLEIPLIRQELEGEIQQNLVELRKKSDTAQYPGAELDRLFAASYRHMHRTEPPSQECLCTLSQSDHDPVCSEALASSCDVLGCDVEASGTPSRRMRFASGIPTPLVHIGTVGGTSVVKSGEHRDTIARENDIIAFEMEGAGVWEDLPCIIIKGVCDYADSHKNKIWQNYAAAAAASAAKAFLDYWTSRPRNSLAAEGSSKKRPRSNSDEDDSRPSRRVRQQSLPRRQSSISDLDRTNGTNSTPLDPALGNSNARQLRLDALNFEQLDARHSTIKAAHAATCEWLLGKSEYTDWQDEEKLLEHHGFLWIKGKPGAGKSTIMKFAYTNAEKDARGSTAISYFFNASGEPLEKSTCGMYRSLLFQLLSKLPRLQAVLSTTEAARLQNTAPDLWTTEILQSLFRQAIEKLEGQHLTCFVDALDECENNEDQVREMIAFFEELGECAVKNKVRLLVCFSSRHYPHITIDKSVEFTLEVQQEHSEDITKYTNSKLRIGRSKKSEQIKTDVQKKSQGIFLWVVLVVPILKKVWDHGKIDDLDNCLQGIPKDLDALFRDILSRDAQNMANLVLCLRWILYAERPLSPAELYFAMLSASETLPVKAWDHDHVTPEDIRRFILSSSKGLAEPTRGKTPTIQFIHESVKDFLLKENGSALLQADSDCTTAGPIHDSLKKHCQRYFSSVSTDHFLNSSRSYSSRKESSRRTAKMFPFLDYSISCVFKHSELAASHGTSQEKFLQEFPLEKWISLHDHIAQYKTHHHGTGTSLLYILSEMNLLNLFRLEVGQSQSINARGGRYDFSIIAAAVAGNKQMLELLLEHGADPDKSGREYRHALLAAADKSNASAFELLIEHDAESSIISTRGLFSALLSLAVKRKNMLITELLLRYHEVSAAAEVLAPHHFRSLVEDLMNIEGDEIFQMLKESGVIRLALCVGCRFALIKASENGKEAVVRMFLDKSEPCYAGDDMIFSGQPLLAAAKNDQEAIVRIVLDIGVYIDALDEDGRTALHWACNHGHEATVRMLLDNGADVNAVDKSGRTGLYFACASGHEAIARTLLDNGADVNKGYPLHAVRAWPSTSYDRCIAAMPTLLEYGADPNLYSPDRDLPLHAALQWGITYVVKLLLDHGADVNIPSSRFENASSALEFCWHLERRAACEALLLGKSSGKV
jgi:ankyrin repeat protein/nucleoside phosphorylase